MYRDDMVLMVQWCGLTGLGTVLYESSVQLYRGCDGL